MSTEVETWSQRILEVSLVLELRADVEEVMDAAAELATTQGVHVERQSGMTRCAGSPS